jgi:hypothetical protein
MVFYRGTQIIEGIDKIKVMLHPCLNNSIQFRRYVSFENHLILVRSMNKFNLFYYLLINAEFIDPEVNMLRNIASAIMELIRKGIILIRSDDYNFEKSECDKKNVANDLGQMHQVPKDELEYEITEDFIYRNIKLFISGIYELEFYFDLPSSCIEVSENAVIFDFEDIKSMNSFYKYKKDKRNNPIKAIIKYNTTLYSSDYDSCKRDSTLICYDRAERLIAQNQIKHEVINNNNYKMRIEFRLKRNNSKYLVMDNLDGTYDEIINKYIPLLSILYHRFFFGLIIVSNSKNKYFNKLYERARENKERYCDNEIYRTKYDSYGHISFGYIYGSFNCLISLLDADATIKKHKDHLKTDNANSNII